MRYDQEINRNGCKRLRNNQNHTKTKYLRIAQVSFQAKLDASRGTTTAGSKSREIQKQQLMPVGAWR